MDAQCHQTGRPGKVSWKDEYAFLSRLGIASPKLAKKSILFARVLHFLELQRVQ